MIVLSDTYPIKMSRSHPRTMGGKIALSMHCAASSTRTVAIRIFSFVMKERRTSDCAIKRGREGGSEGGLEGGRKEGR